MASELQIDLGAFSGQTGPRKHIIGRTATPSSVPGAERWPEDFGERLRIARESAGRSIADAAEKLDVPASVIRSFEAGEHFPGYRQKNALAGLYRTTTVGVLGWNSVLVNLASGFKGTAAREDRATKDAILLLTRLAQSEIELELALEVGHKEDLPGCLPLLAGDVQPQAERNAARLRELAGMGACVSPVQGLTAVYWLEQEAGVRIHVRQIDDSIRGVYVHDPEVGACVLLNSSHPIGSLSEALAHALAHLCSFRDTPCVQYLGVHESTRKSRYADAFARAFLMPRETVVRKFREYAGKEGRLSRRHAVLMAYQFGVSIDSVFPRLSELGLVDADSEENLWGGRIAHCEALGILGDAGVGAKSLDASAIVVPRIHLLAEQSWRRLLHGEGHLSRMLDMDRIDLRGVMGPMEPDE